MGDWLGFFWRLAEAFFKSFATAVTEYPLPTFVVFVVSFLLWDDTNEQFPENKVIAGLIQFVLTVIVANVVGFIFNGISWVLKVAFNVTGTSVSIFKEHPVEFIIHALFWFILALAALFYKNKWKYKNIPKALFVASVIPVIWISYVTTNIHVHVVGDKKPAPPAVIDGAKK